MTSAVSISAGNRWWIGLPVAIATLVISSFAVAEEPADGNGRFQMSPVDGGFLRLDTQTGDVSLCTKTSTSWACEPVKDTGSTMEALREENNALKEHIKSLEDGMAQNNGQPNGGQANGGSANGFPTAPPGGSTTQLPTEKEIDQAFDYVERMYKKLRDRIERFDKTPQPKAEGQPDGDGAHGKAL